MHCMIINCQPLCMALKLVLTPIVSIVGAVSFVHALRQQSAEAARALVSCQRLHLALLDESGALPALWDTLSTVMRDNCIAQLDASCWSVTKIARRLRSVIMCVST